VTPSVTAPTLVTPLRRTKLYQNWKEHSPIIGAPEYIGESGLKIKAKFRTFPPPVKIRGEIGEMSE